MSELIPAFVEALAKLDVVEKAHTADAGSYRYAYADLGDIVKATRPVLADHGLALVTPVHYHGDGLAVTVSLYHSSGESLTFEPLPFPHGKDAEATGSLITYHRRYALLSALGMAAGEPNPIGDYGDDDGAHGIPLEQPVPGFRSSLMAAREALSEAEKILLRDWLKEQGLPDRPSKMDADQAARTVDWIIHGLPKADA